jgi:pimeloyl-ACP methyl ester carboxylesterase
MSLDATDIELPGPWRHRYVSANGARFHVCEASSNRADAGPLVLLLHGFPEFWWTWRRQLPALAEAGFRAVAMDLRGYGGSDKTPRGYDALTLAADVTGLVRALGSRRAVLVGHGWGGYVAWTAATASPENVSALCVVSAAHPSSLIRAPSRWFCRPAVAHLLAMQMPWLPERRIAKGRYVAQHLARWSASSSFPTEEEADRYRAALARWPAPHCALEYHRWFVRSRARADGRAFNAVMRRQVGVPVLHIGGTDDPAEPAGAVAASGRHVSADFTASAIPGTGHYPHEERPQVFNEVLLGWLSERAGSGADPGG